MLVGKLKMINSAIFQNFKNTQMNPKPKKIYVDKFKNLCCHSIGMWGVHIGAINGYVYGMVLKINFKAWFRRKTLSMLQF